MKKFIGRSTNNRKICTVEFETPLELYNVLVEKGIISLEDGDPMDLARFGKATNKFDENIKEAFAKKYEEFDEIYSGKSRNTYPDFMLQFPDLTDDEIMDVIAGCDGNAYYQEIIDLEEEEEEDEDDELTSVDEAAKKLGVSKSRIYALVKTGKLIREGNEVSGPSVEKYMATRKIGRPWKYQ